MRRIMLIIIMILIVVGSNAEVLIPSWWDASIDDLLIAREWIIKEKMGAPDTRIPILFENWMTSDTTEINSAIQQLENQIVAKGGALPTPLPTYTPTPTWTPVPAQQQNFLIMPTIPVDRIKDYSAYNKTPFMNGYNVLIPKGCSEFDIFKLTDVLPFQDNEELDVTYKCYSNISGEFESGPLLQQGAEFELLLICKMDFKNPELKKEIDNISFSELYQLGSGFEFDQESNTTMYIRQVNSVKVIESKVEQKDSNASSGMITFCLHGQVFKLMYFNTTLSSDDCVDVLYMVGSEFFDNKNTDVPYNLGYINKNSVNVRSDTSQKSSRIATLAENTNVIIIQKCDNDWYKVQFDGNRTGYIKSNYITLGRPPQEANKQSADLSFLDIVGEARDPMFIDNATFQTSAYIGSDADSFKFTRDYPCIVNDTLYIFLDVSFNSNFKYEWCDFGNATILGGPDNDTRIPITVFSSVSKPKQGEKHQVAFVVPLSGAQNKKPSSIRIEPAMYSGNVKSFEAFMLTFAFSWPNR